MGVVNKGQQILSYDFREKGLAEEFNKLNYKLHFPGIYTGGDLYKVSDTSIGIQPFVCVYNDNTNRTAIRIETQDNAIVESVSDINCWIVGRFSWLNTEENYMEFVAVSSENIQPSNLIFGYVDYNGGTMTNDFDYTKKSWEGNHYLNLHEEVPFKVVADEPYSNSVIVRQGGPVFFNNKWIGINSETTSPEISFPVSSFGRTDVVVIDPLDNSVKIIKGYENSTQVPEIATEYFVIGIITLPPSITNTVKGEYIEYINPFKSKTSENTPLSLLEKAKTLDGAGSTVLLDNLGGFNKETYRVDINNISVRNTLLSFLGASISGMQFSITYGNNLFVTSAYQGHNYATSSDGITWVARTPPVTTHTWRNITFGAGRFVVCGHSTILLSSTDGINWTQHTVPDANWQVVGYYNNLFIVLPIRGTTFLTSTDGTNWTSRTDAALGTEIDWTQLSYGAGRWLAVAWGGNIMHSTNGINWTRYNSGYGDHVAIAYGNGIFVMLRHNSGTYYISQDGLTWTSHTKESDSHQSLLFSNGLFIVACLGGAWCYTSTDGLLWRKVLIPGIVSNRQFAFGNGRFVCAGNTSIGYSTPSLLQ